MYHVNTFYNCYICSNICVHLTQYHDVLNIMLEYRTNIDHEMDIEKNHISSINL